MIFIISQFINIINAVQISVVHISRMEYKLNQI
jgi:hypothetical protein